MSNCTKEISKKSASSRINDLKTIIAGQSTVITTLEKSLSMSESQRDFVDKEYKNLYNVYKLLVKTTEDREHYNDLRIKDLISKFRELNDDYDELNKKYHDLISKNEEEIKII